MVSKPRLEIPGKRKVKGGLKDVEKSLSEGKILRYKKD